MWDGILVEAGGECTRYSAWPYSYGRRPSHAYNARTEYVGFSSTRQTLLASSAKGGWDGGGGSGGGRLQELFTTWYLPLRPVI